jgi:hypothetical protein
MLAILESGPGGFGCIFDGKGAGAPSKISGRSMKKPFTGSTMPTLEMAGRPARDPRRDRWVGRSRAKMSAVGAGPSRIREASRWITQREVGATVQPTSTPGREPAHRRAGAPAGDRDLGTARRTGDERPARTLAALRGAVCHAGAGSGGGARRAGAGGSVRRIGPGLVFEWLWTETGCRAVIAELAGQRHHGFDLERAIFLI